MQLFKESISSNLYSARMKQISGYVALGLASVAVTNDISWTGLSEQTQDIISKVGISGAIGMTVGTFGYAGIHELSEFVDKIERRKIEKILGVQAFEVKSDKVEIPLETQNKITVEVQQESIEYVMQNGLQAKRLSLEDLPVLKDVVVEEIKSEIEELNYDVVEKKPLHDYILNKLAGSLEELKSHKIDLELSAAIEEVIAQEENKERNKIEAKTNKKIEPTIGNLDEIKDDHKTPKVEMTIKNTEIDMNTKKDLPMIEMFLSKKSVNNLNIKNKKSIQYPV